MLFMLQNVLEYILEFIKERGRGLLRVLHQYFPESEMIFFSNQAYGAFLARFWF